MLPVHCICAQYQILLLARHLVFNIIRNHCCCLCYSSSPLSSIPPPRRRLLNASSHAKKKWNKLRIHCWDLKSCNAPIVRSQFNRPVHCRLFLSHICFTLMPGFHFKYVLYMFELPVWLALVRRILKKKLLYKQNLVLCNYRKPLFLPIICIIKTVSDVCVCVCVRHHHHLCVCAHVCVQTWRTNLFIHCIFTIWEIRNIHNTFYS
jgi:hypothetical protein